MEGLGERNSNVEGTERHPDEVSTNRRDMFRNYESSNIISGIFSRAAKAGVAGLGLS